MPYPLLAAGGALQILDSPVELVVFFAILVGVMVVGLLAGRKEETSEDYFLAGRGIRWWGVAGSIYGSNVSANHLVGMLGIGFSIGFFQSHFEFGAIFGLMVLCYLFLPVYRKMGLYTLSEYLGKRYDDRSRMAYAVIMVVIMAGVQMIPGLYIGSRTICELVGEPTVATAEGNPLDAPVGTAEQAAAGESPAPPQRRLVDPTYYAIFVWGLAIVAASYTIFGGLKAVVVTDVVQSVLLLFAGIFICVRTFGMLGGWGEMLALDAAADANDAGKMHLYMPSNHPSLPWTGVFTGLMAMHCFYWGTNQFIVQRALGAVSDGEAKLGIIAAGFLKLLIPIFSIATGVAAFYLFSDMFPGEKVGPDAAFARLVGVVVPVGFGLIGLVAAGVLGALLSSIDSMMNSAATIVTIDVYQKYVRPNASDRELITFGRIVICVLCVTAALFAIYVLDPNSEANFFLQIADWQNYLTPGLLVVFFMGMFWKRGNGCGAVAAILAGVGLSWVAEYTYNSTAGMNPAVYNVLMDTDDGKTAVADSPKLSNTARKTLPPPLRDADRATIVAAIEEQRPRLNALNRTFGAKLNFFHRVVFVIGLSAVVHVLISLATKPDEERSKLTWTELGGHAPGDAGRLFARFAISIAVFAALGFGHVYTPGFEPWMAGTAAAIWTLAMIVPFAFRPREDGSTPPLIANDRLWAGLLCAMAVFLHYVFY